MPSSVVLNIDEFCGAERVSRNDGARLRAEIERLWESCRVIVLDFAGLRIASVSFLDEGIALLALKMPLPDLNEALQIQNITEQDNRLLNVLLESRSAQQRPSTSSEN